MAASARDMAKVSSVTRRTKTARKPVPVRSATQVPAAITGGASSSVPPVIVSGTWKSASSVVATAAAIPSRIVARPVSTAALIVTGAMMSRAKGLPSPPVR